MTREEREDAIKFFEEVAKKEINNAKYSKLAIEALEQQSCDKCVYSTKDGYCQYDDITETIPPLKPCTEQNPCETCEYAEGSPFCLQYCPYDAERKKEQQPCNDAISRQAVLNILFYKSDNNGEVRLSKELRDRIKNLPPVTRQTGEWIDGVHAMGYREGYKDAQKQKSGKWIIDRTVVEKTRQYIMHECGHRRITNYHMDVHCSECGFKYAYTTDKEDNIPTNFCPNCGADMRGAE